jgi:AcrR family transcriptional regulator
MSTARAPLGRQVGPKRCGSSSVGRRDRVRDANNPGEASAQAGAAGTSSSGASARAAGKGLDRRRILRAAIEFIDEQGLQALTMRRLGSFLGVEAMALYRYVPSREDLLDGVVDTVLEALHHDPEVHLHAKHGWQNYLQRLAHGIRRIALDHPAVFPLMATRPPAAPWIRPPLRSLRWLESFFSVMADAGFSDDDAVIAYRAYTTFLLGHLLLEVSHGSAALPGDDDENDPAPADRDSAVGLENYPHLRRLESLLDQDETVREFEEALESLLDRLELLQRHSGRR